MGSLALPVLVLNRDWVPIRVTTVMDAMKKLFDGSAKAVLADDYSVYEFEDWADLSTLKGDEYVVVTSRSSIRAPDVILLTRYGDIPEKKLVFTRANIFRRDRHTCQYCGAQPGMEQLTIDHVIPKSRGGQTTWTNCSLACWDCNSRKANRTPEEAGMVLRSKPIKPDWSPRLVMQRVRNTPKNWKRFVNDAYWNTELKNK
jgi:5-methylcytosine-specific restriction endonuclease McrA